MCYERELDRDARREDEKALEEIRRLFARYRRGAGHRTVTEREETAEEPEREPALAER
jgi:hypothetical protein